MRAPFLLRKMTPLAFGGLALAAASCTDSGDDTHRTNHYSAPELVVSASAVAEPMGLRGEPLQRISATFRHPSQPNDLFLGEGDRVFARVGSVSSDDMPGSPTDFTSQLLDDNDGPTEVVLVRGGQEHALRIPMVRPFTIVAPEAIAMGDAVPIDLAPRPALGELTHATVCVNVGCYSSCAENVSFPYVLDTTKLHKLTPELCISGGTIAIEIETAKGKAESIGSRLSPESTATARRSQNAVFDAWKL